MPRILVTGSRDWKDRNRVLWGLSSACLANGWTTEPDEYGNWLPAGDVVLGHGGCPTGADVMADDWALSSCVTTEVHLAEWDRHGLRAGPIRNEEMVAAGADICLAFIRNNSRGASGCAEKAESAGIKTLRFTE